VADASSLRLTAGMAPRTYVVRTCSAFYRAAKVGRRRDALCSQPATCRNACYATGCHSALRFYSSNLGGISSSRTRAMRHHRDARASSNIRRGKRSAV